VALKERSDGIMANQRSRIQIEVHPPRLTPTLTLPLSLRLCRSE
jgi:hypothetical protein